LPSSHRRFRADVVERHFVAPVVVELAVHAGDDPPRLAAVIFARPPKSMLKRCAVKVVAPGARILVSCARAWSLRNGLLMLKLLLKKVG
jgi:hypothetical protein